MKRKPGQHAPEFKARIALEALKGLGTIREIAGEHGTHPVQVSKWWEIMADNAAPVFKS